MKGKFALLTLIMMLFSLIAIPAISHAAVVEGQTTQGEFALWLVREIGAQSKLSPAATGKDATDFLTGLGLVPEGGWKEDDVVTKEMLQSLLEDASGSFDELVDQVKEHADNVLSDRNLGVFRASGVSPSGSAPAA